MGKTEKGGGGRVTINFKCLQDGLGRKVGGKVERRRRLPSKGWAAMIRKVYEIDPIVCPKCGGVMKVVAFITDYQAFDRIIDHLKLTFVAEKPPPTHVFEQVALMAAEGSTEYF